MTAANCRNKTPKLSISNKAENPFPIQPLCSEGFCLHVRYGLNCRNKDKLHRSSQDPVQSTQLKHKYWKSNPLSWPNNNKVLTIWANRSRWHVHYYTFKLHKKPMSLLTVIFFFRRRSFFHFDNKFGYRYFIYLFT